MIGIFVVVVIAVGVIGVIGALLTLLSGRRTWDDYGRGGLLMDSDAPPSRATGVRSGRGPAAATPATRAEREVELRQMVEALAARRRRRGEPELDVDAELTRLTAASAPADDATASGSTTHVDGELRAEIRELVVARNHRRARRGEPPLDVEAEVARQIDGLSR